MAKDGEVATSFQALVEWSFPYSEASSVGHVAGAVIEAENSKGLTFPYRDFSEYTCGLAGDTP